MSESLSQTTRSTDYLKWDGRFYDLLSGEFRPMSDQQGRTHTLARLAIGVFEKGEASRPTSEDREHAGYLGLSDAYSYVPSWAPHVEAKIVARTLDDNRFKYMSGLILRAQVDNVSDLRISLRHADISIGDRTEAFINSDIIVLEDFGPEFHRIKNSVTQQAQDFFDAAG